MPAQSKKAVRRRAARKRNEQQDRTAALKRHEARKTINTDATLFGTTGHAEVMRMRKQAKWRRTLLTFGPLVLLAVATYLVWSRR